jgi:hypothetical protein
MHLRDATASDRDLLIDLVVAAVDWQDGADGADVWTRERVLADDHLARYVEGWLRAGDAGVVAVDDDGAPLGAAWLRLLTAERRGVRTAGRVRAAGARGGPSGGEPERGGRERPGARDVRAAGVRAGGPGRGIGHAAADVLTRRRAGPHVGRDTPASHAIPTMRRCRRSLPSPDPVVCRGRWSAGSWSRR